jgi:hypothetical protein
MHKNAYILVDRHFYDCTLAPKRELDVLRARSPAGSHLLEAGRPHTSITRTATYDRADSNATMRSHAPQAQSHITKAATAVPHILLRGPPEAPNTNAMRRASIRRPNRTQCTGGCTARASTHHGGELIGQDNPHATDSAYQRDDSTHIQYAPRRRLKPHSSRCQRWC